MFNKKFEDGWYNILPDGSYGWLTNQQPNKWYLSWEEPGKPIFGDANAICKGVPECVHKRNKDLPPNEQIGGKDSLFPSETGNYVFKVFHAVTNFGFTIYQEIEGLRPGSMCTINFPMRIHANKNKTEDEDQYLAETGAWLLTEYDISGDGEWGRKITFKEGDGGWQPFVRARRWPYIGGVKSDEWVWWNHEAKVTVPANGRVAVVARGKVKWNQPIDFFLNDFEFNGEFITDPPPPDPDPDPEKRLGDARTDYTRVYNRVSKLATEAEWLAVCKEAFADKQTVGFSNDDAGIGVGLKQKKVVEWGNEIPASILTPWYLKEYGVSDITYRNFPVEVTPPPLPNPTPGVVRPGLHSSADPGDLYGGEMEFAEFRSLKGKVVKVLSNISRDAVLQLARDHKDRDVVWIVRAMISFQGGRIITPTQFFIDTINDVARTIDALRIFNVPDQKILLEIHNEPNLVQEGLGASWVDGKAFNDWYLQVLVKFQAAFPNCRMMFPGLSPGGYLEGIRQDSTQFLQQCTQAIAQSDDLGAHAYWSDTYKMSAAIHHVYLHVKYSKDIWITESSYNEKSMKSGEFLANQYFMFINALGGISEARVKGVTFFVASASNPQFKYEAWVTKTSTRYIATKLQQLLGA